MAKYDGAPIEDHDRGLSFDLPRLVSRGTAVALLAGGVGSVLVAACGGSDGETTTGASATSSETESSGGTTSEIPEETAGPFPGDGSNGPNALTESGVVREDITKSFGSASGVAEGVPTTVEMTLLDVAAGGTPLRARPFTCGTATSPAATRSTTRRSRARTTSEACRRATGTAGSRSRRSSRRRTWAAGRTSTTPPARAP